MAAGYRHRANGFGSKLISQLPKLILVEAAQIGGTGNHIEELAGIVIIRHDCSIGHTG
jgi:hypothetical protein